jgi:hypothetical protein
VAEKAGSILTCKAIVAETMLIGGDKNLDERSMTK